MSRVETYTGPSGPNADGEDFTADTFLEFLRRSHSHWYSDDNVTEQEWVYRGHWDASWRLVPSAARPVSECDKFRGLGSLIEKRLNSWQGSAGWFATASKDDQTILATIFAYADAMRSFMNLCNDMGRNSEEPSPKILCDRNLNGIHIEHWVNAISCGYNRGLYLGGTRGEFPGMKTSIAALAQHHGVPTFLLDWTKDPRIAAYFSATSRRDEVGLRDVCVWALNIQQVAGPDNRNLNRRDTVGSMVTEAGLGRVSVNSPSKADNEYLSSQQGVLTYLSDECGLWKETGEYPSLDDILSSWTKKGMEKSVYAQQPNHHENHQKVIARHFEDEKPLLRKIILKKEHLPQLRRLLRRENITTAHLMPTMDNIASTSLRHATDD